MNPEITQKEEILFKELDNFLSKYDKFQKRAITSDKEKILAIAGAGSGKTTVLTKRIEFLVKYRSVKPEKILAITFTRKARQELQHRLNTLNINTNIETFNSFSEKILKQNSQLIYKTKTKVIDYPTKNIILAMAIQSINLKFEDIIEEYFSTKQKENKTKDQLQKIFLNDCFFILDYLKMKNIAIYDFSQEVDPKHKSSSFTIYKICKFIDNHMKLAGLRDYTDQILDTINFFKIKNLIPEFDHILVDEYQDVNASQIELLDLLNPKNLFCVGDPRQSIFGWRGSDLNNILNFNKKFPDSETIYLSNNYRSNNHIVQLANLSLNNHNFPKMNHTKESEKNIHIANFNSEEQEFNFIIKKIKQIQNKQEIFILARTNNQLTEISKRLKLNKIPFFLKTEHNSTSNQGEITLSTIHSIKGLEAETVFILGCNELNFPCKTSDHPIMESIKIEDYNKENEEQRLFYVAITRAKSNLYLTYSGKKPTRFITKEMNLLLNKIGDLQEELSI